MTGIVDVMHALTDDWMTAQEIGDCIGMDPHWTGNKLRRLCVQGFAESRGVPGEPYEWRASGQDVIVTRNPTYIENGRDRDGGL